MSHQVARKTKNASDTLDYTFDFRAETNETEGAEGDWLDDGENINTHSVDVPDGLTLESEASDDSVVTVWLSGGTVGEVYEIVCEITTDNSPSRVKKVSLLLEIDH